MVGGDFRQPQLGGDAGHQRQLGLVDIEFALPLRAAACPRVFEQRTVAGGGEAHAAAIAIHFNAGGLAQAVGVAFVGLNVAALRGGERGGVQGVFRLPKPIAQSIFASVSEGRVADVVGKAGGLHGGGKVVGRKIGRQLLFGAQQFAHQIAQTAPHAGDFYAVGEAVVSVVVFGERMHLGFAPQPAKGVGKDHAVVVGVKGGTVGRVRFGRHGGDGAVFVDLKTGGRHELLPVHHNAFLSGFRLPLRDGLGSLKTLSCCEIIVF